MPYEVRATRTYNQPAATISRLAAETIAQLGGKFSKRSDAAAGHLEAVFNKEMKRKAFGNRVQLQVEVTAQAPEQCTLAAEAYPVDPVGKKLLFGVLGEPARLVAETFLAELDGRAAS